MRPLVQRDPARPYHVTRYGWLYLAAFCGFWLGVMVGIGVAALVLA